MNSHMLFDDACWEKSDEISDTWIAQFLEPDFLHPVGEFLVKHHKPSKPKSFDIVGNGSFNISLLMVYQDHSAVIRLSQPGNAMFPEEKVRNEVAVMRYILDQTSIPHENRMYKPLNWPGCPGEQRGSLDPNIDENKLEGIYKELAGILLQLSRPSFPRIGSLAQIDDFTWEVAHRPLSMPMNELVRLGSLPQSLLPHPDTTFASASSYFEHLAELHMIHLTNQRNDAICSYDDCRRKFIARTLFRRLAREQKLTKRSTSLDKGPFKLWCDDFRPSNVLISKDLKITGVIDWEFTYVAPVEYTHSPPWWLLIEKPEFWEAGLDDWSNVFERRLQTFLRAMVKCEDEAISKGQLDESQRLSRPMRESWETGDFWISYAARNNFAFDMIYWAKIDPRFFWPAENREDAWMGRLGLLSEEEKDEMEKLVTKKADQARDRALMWDPDEYTLENWDIAQKVAAAKASKAADDDENDLDRETEEAGVI
ncbi:hypothetical protein BJX99DRAFT_245621 [Aspergillus californicus]